MLMTDSSHASSILSIMDSTSLVYRFVFMCIFVSALVYVYVQCVCVCMYVWGVGECVSVCVYIYIWCCSSNQVIFWGKLDYSPGLK